MGTAESSSWKKFKNNPRGFCERFLRDNAIFLVLLFIYILFYKYWETWIGNSIIDKFLCHFESNLLSVIITVIICLIFILMNWKKRNNLNVYFISFIVFIFWFYYRFICSDWGQHSSCHIIFFPKDKNIKYVDIVPLLVIIKIVFIPVLRNYFKEKDASFDGGFIIDNPIDNKDEDVLGREPLAIAAADLLLNTNTKEGSFTFGIDSPWGTGKTTFMNLMKTKIEEHTMFDDGNQKQPILIDFNPWLYAEKKDLTTVFFDELSNSLKQFDHSLAKTLIDYAKLLSSFGTTETKMISSLLELTQHEDSSLQNKKQQISKAIKRIKRRIIVFIDDIDRLDDNEILEIMKLIRNTSDFPYMYFVAAYDKAYLAKCLKNKMPTKELGFTEKIFQVECVLPECSKNELKIKSLRLLKESINEIDANSINFIVDKNELDLFNTLSNIREIKRLINSYHLSHRLLKEKGLIDKVNYSDLFKIEFIKIVYPFAYSFFTNYRTRQNEGEDAEFINKDIRYVTSSLENLSDIDKTDINLISNILYKLYEAEPNSKTKALENCFFPHETNVALSDFNKLMKEKDIDSIIFEIKLLSIRKKNSLKERLSSYNPSNTEDRKKFITVLIYSTSLDMMGNKHDLITNQIKEFISTSSERDLSENKAFIQDKFVKYGNKFICLYFYYLVYEEGKWDFPLSREEVNKIRIGLFEKSLNDAWSNIPDILDCFKFTVDREKKGNEDIKNYIPIINEKMKSYAVENIVSLIPFIIKEYSKPKNSKTNRTNISLIRRHRIDPIVEQIWGSWDAFRIFLSELDDTSDVITEFKEFYDVFEKENYGYVVFKFKYINPR